MGVAAGGTEELWRRQKRMGPAPGKAVFLDRIDRLDNGLLTDVPGIPVVDLGAWWTKQR
jgi:hypothetical protein